MSKIPKDKEIVIETPYGTKVAIWSKPDNKFVYANVQVDLYEGEWNMKYFENEHIEEKDIIKWREL